MRGDALTVFLSFWAEANEEGFFEYLAPMTDIMKHTFNKNRYPSIDEKKRFWKLSKLLENTKLTLTLKIENNYITIKHPLLTLSITASKERGQEVAKGYPDKILARVLNPNAFQKTATLATEIYRGTLKMKGEDGILIALLAQTKASQRRNQSDPLKFDEARPMEAAGLAKTYNANPRVARQRLTKKLNKAIEAESFESWQKNNSKIIIHKRQQKNDAK